MVSPEQPQQFGTAPAPESTRVVRDDRGVIREPLAEPAITPSAIRTPAFSYFWGAVITGTLVAITFTVMSIALMIGCHVGTVSATGAFIPGWGAAVWTVITACLAYFLGSYVAARMSTVSPGGWISGMAVWGLSIPLLTIITALVAIGGGTLLSPASSATGHVHVAYGQMWTLFASLIAGVFCAAMGGEAGARVRR